METQQKRRRRADLCEQNQNLSPESACLEIFVRTIDTIYAGNLGQDIWRELLKGMCYNFEGDEALFNNQLPDAL